MTLSRNLTVLFVCQALYWGAVIIGITLSAIVGASLAPLPVLATLPAALLTVGAIMTTAPVSLLMQRVGRRAGFRIGTTAGMLGGALGAYSIVESQFIGFCLANLLLGVYQACANYYRLAATDSVPAARAGRAIAWVMAGGVLAALLAPTLSLWSKDLFDATYAGSYIAVTLLSIAATLCLGLLAPAELAGKGSPERSSIEGEIGATAARPLSTIVRQPAFIAAVANAGVSHGTMILVMTTTPLAMIAHQHRVEDAAFVIQWHVLGMFLPAFVSGKLVDRFGASTVAMAGAAVLTLSVSLAIAGITLAHFWASSLLLGAGWNLMYVAGTTLIARSHRPEERGRVQGMAEFSIAIVAAASAFSSGALLAYLGWSAVNAGAIPLLLAALAVSVWYRQAELAVRRQEAAPVA